MPVTIPLTQGKVAIVDDEDASLIAAHGWYAAKVDLCFYARCRVGGKKVYMHRLVAAAMGLPEVDHADGDGLNNRRSNLRACTRALNEANKMKARRNGSTSRYKGVSGGKGRWRALFCFNKRTVCLGTFPREEDAAHAYDEAARQHFGSFACVNFPRDGERGAVRASA